MLNEAQRRYVIAAALLISGALAAWFFNELRGVPAARLAGGALEFQPARARVYTAGLTRYPHRVTGTQSSQRAAQYIVRQFRALGYRVRLQHFPLWFDGKRVIGENVLATSRASSAARYVAVLAHYDGPRTSPFSAEDDASGVGTMLELARVMRHRIAHPIFVATDAEEVGMIGARALAPYLRAQGEGTAISIDYVNAGGVRGLELTASGQFGGYTPLWLRELARAAEAQQSSFVQYPYGIREWVERAVDRSFQDDGPLLHAGIAAVNVGTVPLNRRAAMARYHTPADRYANFTDESFRMTGRAVERMMLTLAQSRRAPGTDGFRVSPTEYVSLGALWGMQLLALGPLLLAMVFACWNMGVRVRSIPTFPDVPWIAVLLAFDVLASIALTSAFIAILFVPVIWAIVRIPDKTRFAMLALPPIAAYVLVTQLAQHNAILPRYEIYPPPPKDPLLYHPPVLLAILVAIVLVIGYASISRWKTPLFEKRSLFAWTTVVVLAGFAIQPYGMWLYLGVFAYAALLFVERPGKAALATNVVLGSAAALPFAAVLWFYANEMSLGGYVLWYLALQSAYGTWSYWIVGTAIVAAVVWVQFIRLALAKAPAWIPLTLPKPRPAART